MSALSEMISQRQGAADYDPIKQVSTHPARVDPLTRLVLTQLSGPPTMEALLFYARLRAVAVSPFVEDSHSAWAGSVVAWVLNSDAPLVLDEDMVHVIEEADIADESGVDEMMPVIDLAVLNEDNN